ALPRVSTQPLALAAQSVPLGSARVSLAEPPHHRGPLNRASAGELFALPRPWLVRLQAPGQRILAWALRVKVESPPNGPASVLLSLTGGKMYDTLSATLVPSSFTGMATLLAAAPGDCTVTQ